MRSVILLVFSIILSANVAFADSCFIAKADAKEKMTKIIDQIEGNK